MEVKTSPVITALMVLQRVIQSKDAKEVEAQIPGLEADRTISEYPLVSLRFKNSLTNNKSPILKDFILEAEEYSAIFHKLLNIQDEETQHAIKLLYLYMCEKKSFNLDMIDGKELLSLGGYDRIRKEMVHKVLKNILNYLGMTTTVLDPRKTHTKQSGKKTVEYKTYSNFTVLQVGYVHTKKEESEDPEDPDGSKEYIYALSNVKFMEGYMEYIYEVSRAYLPLEVAVSVPKVSAKDKRRLFIGNLCEKLVSGSNKSLKLTLEESMKLGDFCMKRWTKDKAKAWKPIEAALITAKSKSIIKYKWFLSDNKTIDSMEVLDPKLFKLVDYVEITRTF